MKNKKLLYILIPATLVLWGAIIYRIIGAFHGEDEASLIVSNKLTTTINDANVNDTFSINPTYRDPFFGKMMRITTTENKKPITTNPPVVPKNVTSQVQWPTITYNGLIKNQSSNKQLIMVTVNGQSQTLKLGDKIGDLELTKALKDSVEFKLGKEKRFFRK